MKKELFFISKGFSLAEILVATFVFLIFSLAFFNLLSNSLSQITYASEKERATALAEEGLEAVRNIKEADFDNLVNGNYGLNILENRFELSDSFDTTDIFNREITISSLENDFLIKKVESEVSWKNDKSITLITYFTNWSEILEDDPIIETCQDYCMYIGYTSGVCRQNRQQCERDDGVYQEDGDEFCPRRQGQNICCCQ